MILLSDAQYCCTVRSNDLTISDAQCSCTVVMTLLIKYNIIGVAIVYNAVMLKN